MQKIYNSKNTYYGLLMITIALIISLSGCKDTCEITTTYVYYSPVYTSMEEIRASVATEPSKEMTQLGKIYFRGKYLFINEPNSGVHVINNADPSNPVNEAFINIPGSFDIAVDGNILYSDSYIDMVAIDISDINNVREVGRVKNIFPSYNSYGFYADEQQGIVTGWKEEGDPSLAEGARFRTDADGPARQIAVDRGNTIITVSEEQAQEWRTLVEPIYATWVSEMEGRGIDGQALIDQARSLMDEYAASN